MYKEDNFEMEHIAKLLQRFGNQTLDFFGAIRASTYDGQILCALGLPLAPVDPISAAIRQDERWWIYATDLSSRI